MNYWKKWIVSALAAISAVLVTEHMALGHGNLKTHFDLIPQTVVLANPPTITVENTMMAMPSQVIFRFYGRVANSEPMGPWVELNVTGFSTSPDNRSRTYSFAPWPFAPGSKIRLKSDPIGEPTMMSCISHDTRDDYDGT